MLDLIDQDESSVLLAKSSLNIFDLGSVQNSKSELQVKNLLKEIFESKQSLNKKQVLQNLLKNREAKDLLQEFLQTANIEKSPATATE